MKRSYRKSVKRCVLFSIAGLQAAFVLPALAVPIFNITTATKSITVSPGQTINLTYLVKNVSGISMPQMRYFPPAGTTITAASTCGTTLANLASCNIVLKYTVPASVKSPQHLQLGPLSVCGFVGKVCSKANSDNLVTITILNLATLIAGGQNTTNPFPFILLQSTDGGASWSFPTVVGATTNPASIRGATCTGSTTADTVCVAAGSVGVSALPLVTSTTDGGTTWSVKPISGIPVGGNLLSASCTGSGSTSVCAASGNTSTFGGDLLIVASTDGAATWSVKTLPSTPAGSLESISCTGSGSTSICAAAGTLQTGPNAPVLLVSNDGTATWTVKPFSGTPLAGNFNSVSCTGSGATAICIAGGLNVTAGNTPLIAASTDGGLSWSVKSISGATTGRFTSVSCSGSTPSSTICAAVGANVAGGVGAPLLAVSTDGANTWTVKTVSGAPSDGLFRGVSCTGSGTDAICVAAGFTPTTFPTAPFLAVSSNGGNTWAVKPISGAPAQGSFSGVSCTGSGSTAVCVAVGGDNIAPLIAISTDGANTWSVVSIAGTPASGSYSTAGSTGG